MTFIKDRTGICELLKDSGELFSHVAFSCVSSLENERQELNSKVTLTNRYRSLDVPVRPALSGLEFPASCC